MKKLLAAVIVAALCLTTVPTAEAGPLRKAARGAKAFGRFIKNHLPHPFRRGC